MTRKLNIAIVGMGFGAEFIPIYQRHPNANMYAICQRNKAHLDEVGDKFGIAARYTDFAELIADPNVDAVHINSPIDEHAWMSMDALQGGQARGLHRADGAHDRGVPPGRRGAEAVGQEVLHDGDDRLHPRVPVRQGTGGEGRARPHPVHPRGAPPGDGRGQLAELLARHAADALRHALRRPGARPDRQVHRVGLLPRLRPGG